MFNVGLNLAKQNYRYHINHPPLSFKGTFGAIEKRNSDSFELKNKNRAKISPDMFYVKMFDYRSENETWANKMAELTNQVSIMMKEDINFDEILSYTEDRIQKINLEDSSNHSFGVSRGDYHKKFDIDNQERGCEYLKPYDEKLSFYFKKSNTDKFYPKANDEYKNANTCYIKEGEGYGVRYYRVRFPNLEECEISNLDLVKDAYNKLRKTTNPTLNDINKICATISWLISQETPYFHGSNSIQNVLIRAIYKLYDINTFAVKEGKSLDFEAFYSDLDEYIKKYPTFFERKPKSA